MHPIRFQFYQEEVGGWVSRLRLSWNSCQRCQCRPLRMQNIKWVNISHLPRYSDTKFSTLCTSMILYFSEFINCISRDRSTWGSVHVTGFWNGNKSTQSFMSSAHAAISTSFRSDIFSHSCNLTTDEELSLTSCSVLWLEYFSSLDILVIDATIALGRQLIREYVFLILQRCWSKV